MAISREWRAVVLVSIGASMSSLDLTLMFVAYPEIRKDFEGTSLGVLSWVLTSFTIVAASLLIPAGRLCDRLGRKRVFLTSLLLFSFGSGCVAIAPTVPLIIAARVVQAIGGAMLTPSSLAIIMTAMGAQRRSAAIGAWSAISGTVTSAAPTLGALAIEIESWRLAFLLVLPIGLVCFVLGWRWLDESVDEQPGRLPDPLGSMLVFIGVGTLAYAIVQSKAWGVFDARTLGVLALAAAALAYFVYRCRTQAVPVIDFAVFRVGTFRANALAGVLIGTSFWGMYSVVVVFLTVGWGLKVLAAGLWLTPMTLVSTLIAFKGGELMDRHGHRIVMVPAAACLSLGALVLLGAGDERSFGLWLVAALLIGVTTTLYLGGVNSAGARLASPEHLGIVAGVVQTLIRVGGVIGASASVLLIGDIEAGDGVREFRPAWIALMVAGVIAMAAAWPLRTKPAPK